MRADEAGLPEGTSGASEEQGKEASGQSQVAAGAAAPSGGEEASDLTTASPPDQPDDLEVLPAPPGAGPVEPVSATRVVATWILGVSVAAIGSAALQFVSGQTQHGFFLLSLAVTVVFAATWTDVATRRIPNVLTYPAILLGILFNGLAPFLLERWNQDTALVFLGSSGTADCFLGFGLCAAIGLLSFLVRGLGGGDVKLLGALGALIGFTAVVAALFNTLLVAALIGILNWTLGGSLMRRLQGLAHAVYFSVIMRADMRTVYRFRPTEGPFALSLLIGLVSSQFVALHRVLFGVAW